jgi:hypothetical protein
MRSFILLRFVEFVNEILLLVGEISWYEPCDDTIIDPAVPWNDSSNDIQELMFC